jgi:hypothetical protein
MSILQTPAVLDKVEPGIAIAVINESSVVTDTEIKSVVHALQATSSQSGASMPTLRSIQRERRFQQLHGNFCSWMTPIKLELWVIMT